MRLTHTCNRLLFTIFGVGVVDKIVLISRQRLANLPSAQ